MTTAAAYDPLAEDDSPDANFEKSIRLTAETTTIVAAIRRFGGGLEPVVPRSYSPLSQR